MSQAKVKATRLKAARVSTKAQSTHVLQQQQEIVDQESHNFRLGDTTTQTGSTILTVFHVKESKFEIDKRIQLCHHPYQYNPMKRFADTTLYRQVLPIPLRPVWNNHNTREQLQQNEIDKFDQYLKVIYDSIPPSRLTHFEHNLDVWRQLWRVCEISDLLCACVDARHPLFHFPPALYDFIVKKLKKPLILILNKIDLVPTPIINAWEKFLKRIYPDVHIIKFSSHPNPESTTPVLITQESSSLDKNFNNNYLSDDSIRLTKGMSVQGSQGVKLTGAGTVHKYQPLGSALLKTFWNILSHIVENQSQLSTKPTGPLVTNQLITFALDYARRIGANDGTNQQIDSVVPQYTYDLGSLVIPKTVLVTDVQEIEDKFKRHSNKINAKGGNINGGGDAEDNNDDNFLGFASNTNEHDKQLILQKIKELEIHAQDDNTQAPATRPISTKPSNVLDDDNYGIDMEDSMGNSQSTLNFKMQKKIALTIGMVGHPNAGKSSLINAILGRPAVSVSNTPGHTKHLQTLTTIPNCSESIRLCDSPGIVFPAVDISRSLQTLLGIFPYPKLVEPYTCVQFLAERLPLVNLYQLKPYFGADSDALLHGAAHPGGDSSAFVENFQELMLQHRYNGDLCPDEVSKKLASISSNQSTDVHPIFVDGTVTSPIPSEISGGINTTSTTSSNTAPILVNGIDIASLAPTAPTNKKKAKTAKVTQNTLSKGSDLFDTLDQLLVDSRFDSYTNPRYIWSAYRICEAYAIKKSWFTESSGKPNTFKAGMAIIKDCVDGRLNLYFLPPQLQSLSK